MNKNLHIITNLTIGGAESMLLRLIKSRSDLYKSTIVISLMENAEIGKVLEEMGIKVIKMGMTNWWSAFRTIIKIKHIINRENPSIIHTWMYHANIIGGLAGHLAKNKNIVWSIRRSEYSYSESLSTFIVMKIGAIFSYLIPRVIVHVADSGLKNHQKYGYNSKNSIVIPNGFDTNKLRQNLISRKKIRNELNIYDNQTVIGCVGRFHESKGYEILVSSSTDVLKVYKNVKYLLIGRNVNEQNSILKKWIKKTGFSRHFILLGEKNNIADYMNAMDIFCLSSVTEGFPNVLGEAMAMELPCVVTRVGDVKKIIGNNAVLVEPKSKTLLSKGLCEILGMDVEKRKKMGQRGRNKIEAEYPLKSVCKKYYDLYSLISNEKRPKQ